MIKSAVALLDLFNVLERIGTFVGDHISWEGVNRLAVAWLDLFNVLEQIATFVGDQISWEGVTRLWPMRREG